MSKTLPAAPKPALHLLVGAFGVLFATFAAAFGPELALGMTVAVVAFLARL
jgi:uncharacterized membrane protein YdcZ (DUF606 family)